jgi:hypothetical protein
MSFCGKLRKMLREKFLLSETRILWTIFFAFLIVRVSFVLLSGYDNFELFDDTSRYNLQSDAILAGKFNLLSNDLNELESLFITAPFYPYLQALFKLLFGSYWILAFQTTQILLCCLSGVFLYKTAKIIWNRDDVAIIASAIYCFYPLTLWWVHTFGQEMPFQCLLIFTVFFLLKAVYKNHFPSLIISAVLFSSAFLTKSHILLFAPFIPLFIFLAENKTLKQKLAYAAAFSIICFVFTLPYGLYNLKVNGVYVISSTGQGTLFLIGHNDDMYKAIVSPPRAAAIMGYEVISRLKARSENLTHSEIQKLYFDEGIKWCLENPQKFLKLKIYNLYYFLTPGLNPNYYTFNRWLAAFIISFPVYIFAYFGIFSSLKQNFRKHFWILGLFVSMIIFSVGFYVQNRFRTVTIELFYILYAAMPIADSFHLLTAKIFLQSKK